MSEIQQYSTTGTNDADIIDPWTALAIAGGQWAVEKGINVDQNKKDREFQERMTKEQWAEEQRRWQQNIDYNDPSMVMQRYKSAGLNPALMYKGTTTPAQTMGKAEKQTGKFGLGESQLQIAQIAQMMAQTESIKLDNYAKKDELGLTKPKTDEDGKPLNTRYTKQFNDAVKSAEEALNAEQQKELSKKKLTTVLLCNQVLEKNLMRAKKADSNSLT